MKAERNILIVANEQGTIDSIKTSLRKYDYKVDIAYSDKEGIEKIKEKSYELLITDLGDRDKDYNVVKFAKEESPDSLIILLTGHASTESAIEAIHQGIFDYLTKPLDIDVLKRTIERAFHILEIRKLREDTISMITHDIKTPLTTILGYCSLLIDKNTNKIHPNAKEFVEKISNNSQKIIALVDNYLTSCKIEAGQLGVFKQMVDVKYLLDEVIAMLYYTASSKNIKFDVQFEEHIPIIKADENLLFRAVSNIISNAIKYSPPGYSVIIKVQSIVGDSSPINSDAVAISISNIGKGIAKKEIPHIFDRYRRSKSVGGIEGSGIGLYVVKFIMEAHSGGVTLESEQDGLTTFNLFLPYE